MFGRRSYQRFSVAGSPAGTLRVLRDVLIERVGPGEVVAIGRHPAAADDVLTLEASERGNVLPVRVLESRPTLVEGTVRHRLSLSMIDKTAESPLTQPEGAVNGSGSSLAVLAKTIPVRLLNCSSCGCLLECFAPMDIALIASVHIAMDGEELADDMHIVRCQQIEGSSRYHVGGEFLWTGPPSRHSLRLFHARLAQDLSSFSMTKLPD